MSEGEGEVFTRELPCKLTAAAREQYGKQMAQKVNARDLLDAKRKMQAATYAAEIKGYDAEIKRCAQALESDQELRPVECTLLFRAGTMQTIRLDTNEVVDVRPAEPSEAQPPLPHTVPHKGGAPARGFPDLDEGPTGPDLAAAGTPNDDDAPDPDPPDDADGNPGPVDAAPNFEFEDEADDQAEVEKDAGDEAELEAELEADLDAAFDQRA
jgi:hypothetical protein